jgi:hypothetical protein
MEPKILTGNPHVGAIRVSRQLLAGCRGVMCITIETDVSELREQLNLF